MISVSIFGRTNKAMSKIRLVPLGNFFSSNNNNYILNLKYHSSLNPLHSYAFLGAGQDVGRSCILMTINGRNIMFDCGMVSSSLFYGVVVLNLFKMILFSIWDIRMKRGFRILLTYLGRGTLTWFWIVSLLVTFIWIIVGPCRISRKCVGT